ncbi:hypothetical protein LSH36_9g06008 [Paralvinella palmiformis]|uniref:Uncharacterized protein n=1 Tax=Paralvinella palmiformis TaxID=53620 RepID=A0AAD9KE60_9ANNE|nr:hypothetical protein LSH36_9g06008 [Paralvinella palmiformis]
MAHKDTEPLIHGSLMLFVWELSFTVVSCHCTLEGGDFGSSLIWAMISQGETIYCTQSPVDMDITHQNKWNEFLNLVAKVVSSLSKDNLAVPHENFPKVITHMQRFLDKRTFLTIEDKLQLLVTAAVS